MSDRPATEAVSAPQPVDDDTAEWVRWLSGTGPEQDAAVARLHALLLRVSRAELVRRATRVSGPELDDLAHQAADDATVAVLAKLAGFRGESRFTTWAYKFAVFEVSGKVGRHAWRHGEVPLDAAQWERLPERLGDGPADQAEAGALAAAVRRAVEEELTAHQRRLFVAVVVDGVPLDALVAALGTNRNAVYKTVFDARRKIRRYLVTHGYMEEREVSGG
jgi:RNA polymerase sigma-70 factor (ECF subfamily)